METGLDKRKALARTSRAIEKDRERAQGQQKRAQAGAPYTPVRPLAREG